MKNLIKNLFKRIFTDEPTISMKQQNIKSSIMIADNDSIIVSDSPNSSIIQYNSYYDSQNIVNSSTPSQVKTNFHLFVLIIAIALTIISMTLTSYAKHLLFIITLLNFINYITMIAHKKWLYILPLILNIVFIISLFVGINPRTEQFLISLSNNNVHLASIISIFYVMESQLFLNNICLFGSIFIYVVTFYSQIYYRLSKNFLLTHSTSTIGLLFSCFIFHFSNIISFLQQAI